MWTVDGWANPRQVPSRCQIGANPAIKTSSIGYNINTVKVVEPHIEGPSKDTLTQRRIPAVYYSVQRLRGLYVRYSDLDRKY